MTAVPPDRIEQLRARREKYLRAMEDVTTPPRLRDRNMFFHVLLNGDRAAYERDRPRWLEYRRNRREARRIAAEICAEARRKLEREPGYRALVAEAGKEEDLRVSCRRLVAAIRKARQRIDRADGRRGDDEVSRSTVKRDTREVRTRLGKVRTRAEDVRVRLGDRPSGFGDLAGLDISFSVRRADPKERGEQYTKVRVLLGSLEASAKSLSKEASARKREAESKGRQYVEKGQARYLR